MAELKPFKCACGKTNVWLEQEGFLRIGLRYWVWCPSCKARTDIYDTEEEAISAWNKRS